MAAKRKLEASNENEALSDGDIVWPPCVIIENTRVFKGSDGKWSGLGNPEVAAFLAGIGHTLGRPKSSWGKEGHKGQVIVQYPATSEGLKEAERLHEHFKSHKRGHGEWMRVKSMWHGLPGHEGIHEGPDLKRVDEETNMEKRVLYGYLAKVCDLGKFPVTKKKYKMCRTISRMETEKWFE